MNIQKDFPLNTILWYKIGGKAQVFIQAFSKNDILEALSYLENEKIHKLFVCGLGANLIFTDEYYDGAVLMVADGKHNHLTQNDDGIEAFSGTVLDDVITYSLEKKRVGLEWAGGLPGTVGAGVRGNVGAFGGEIEQVLKEADVVTFRNGIIKQQTLSNEELKFAYRHSLVKEEKNMIVLSARFVLPVASEEAVGKAREEYEKNIAYRASHHPLEYPNCGSVFKNIKGEERVQKVLAVWPDIQELVDTKWHGKVSMGYIIKRFGFSGKKVGNAQVSEKHANFIVNLGDAKAHDVITIITEIQQKAQETFGFTPEVEVEIVA